MAKLSTPCKLSHKNFAKSYCFKRTLKNVLPRDTLSHNFLNTMSHKFYQKRTSSRIIFMVKGHPAEQVNMGVPPRVCGILNRDLYRYFLIQQGDRLPSKYS